MELLTLADTLAGNRVAPLVLDRAPDMPFITYQRISTPRELSHDGDQHYAEFRVQVNCWATRTDTASGYLQVKQLAEETRAALHGFKGTAGGVTVGMMLVTNDRDDRDPQRTLERVSVDCVGNYQE